MSRPAAGATAALLSLGLWACGASPTEPRAAPPPAAPVAAPALEPMAAPAASEPEGTEGPARAAPNAAAYAEATAFTSAEVKKVVRQHFDQVGDCYSEGLRRDPDLKGTIEMRLTISQEGKVLGAVAKKDPPGQKARHGSELLTDHEVVSCVEEVFEGLKFAPTGEGMVNLVYPVNLRTE